MDLQKEQMGNALLLRRTILDSIREVSLESGERVSPKHIFVPPSHRKALAPEIKVVKGMRGAGKTFWWRAIQHKKNLQYLIGGARVFELERVETQPCFGAEANEGWPGKDELKELAENGLEHRLVWKTVVLDRLRQTLNKGRFQSDALDTFPAREGWLEKCRWVTDHPSEVKRAFMAFDEALERAGKQWMGLFDALDRTATSWREMDQWIRGLLMCVQDLETFYHIRLKCFLRTDQLEGREISNFPDSSKVLARSVELQWTRRDLYNLFWHYLLNFSDDANRAVVEEVLLSVGAYSSRIVPDEFGVRSVPEKFGREEELQRKAFHKLTGPYMGTDHRKGYPYTWLVNHLSDAIGRVSPRSFIVAIREAAQDSEENYPDHEYALHYNSIKRGVQKASQRRVDELAEDYPWIRKLMAPLEGLLVPVEFEEIKQRWDQTRVLEKLSEEERLPPEHIEEGALGVCEDLINLGIFRRIKDSRIDLPDIYRVAFGLGRKGGVRPVK